VPVDPSALVTEARELHEDADAWGRHSKRGRAAVVERHTAEVYADRLERIYEQVVATSGRGDA
jgi:hypothetical protein